MVMTKAYTFELQNGQKLRFASQKTLDVFETVDGCVPSAGIAIDKPFVEQTWEEFTRIQEINVSGESPPKFLCHSFTDQSHRSAAHSSQPN